MFFWGKPIMVKKNLSKKEDVKLSNKLEKTLIKLTKDADSYCN